MKKCSSDEFSRAETVETDGTSYEDGRTEAAEAPESVPPHLLSDCVVLTLDENNVLFYILKNLGDSVGWQPSNIGFQLLPQLMTTDVFQEQSRYFNTKSERQNQGVINQDVWQGIFFFFLEPPTESVCSSFSASISGLGL